MDMTPYEYKPSYRIRVAIYDETTDHDVTTISQPMYSQEGDNTPIVFRALDMFKRDHIQHEAIHYPELATQPSSTLPESVTGE